MLQAKRDSNGSHGKVLEKSQRKEGEKKETAAVAPTIKPIQLLPESDGHDSDGDLFVADESNTDGKKLQARTHSNVHLPHRPRSDSSEERLEEEAKGGFSILTPISNREDDKQAFPLTAKERTYIVRRKKIY